MNQPTTLPPPRHLVASREALVTSIIAFDHLVHNLDAVPNTHGERHDLRQALARARAWVAIWHQNRWMVGFAKWVGYADQTPISYTAFRKIRDERRLDGTAAERKIKSFGGTAYAVGMNATGPRNHPAVQAVIDLCHKHGKAENALAEVFVLAGEQEGVSDVEQAKIDLLVAAIHAANLSPHALAELLERVQ
jgi:hypothetical protein